MTDRDDAVAALTKAVLILVDESRQARAVMQEAGGKIGQLCDRIDDYAQRSDTRHADSERNIRVLQTKVADVERRQKSLEERFAASGSKSAR